MNESETISTIDVLVGLGFEPIADPFAGLAFDFGNFKLRASELVNLQFQRVVHFSGVLATPRTVAEVVFDLPIRVISREQCIAMIAYFLDKAANGREFQPDRQGEWIAIGRQYKHLLPWEIEKHERMLKEAPYRARPHCLVRRDWARLALKTLAQYLDDVSDETPVVFSFKESVLTITCKSEVIALTGTGQDWPIQYSIPAGQIRTFPNRLQREQIEVSIWEGKLRIGNHLYPGVTEIPVNEVETRAEHDDPMRQVE